MYPPPKAQTVSGAASARLLRLQARVHRAGCLTSRRRHAASLRAGGGPTEPSPPAARVRSASRDPGSGCAGTGSRACSEAPAAPLTSSLAPPLPRSVGHKNSERRAIPPFRGGLPRCPARPAVAEGREVENRSQAFEFESAIPLGQVGTHTLQVHGRTHVPA